MVHLFLRINGCNGNEFEELETTSVQESIILFQRSEGPRKKGLQKQQIAYSLETKVVWQLQPKVCNQRKVTRWQKTKNPKKENPLK